MVKQILNSIAEFDAILSSGHLHVYEIWKLFTEAKKRGVKRLIINHPMYGLHFTYDDIKELAELGALIEQSACLYVDSRFNVYSPQELKEHILAAGVAHSRSAPISARSTTRRRWKACDRPSSSALRSVSPRMMSAPWSATILPVWSASRPNEPRGRKRLACGLSQAIGLPLKAGLTACRRSRCGKEQETCR